MRYYAWYEKKSTRWSVTIPMSRTLQYNAIILHLAGTDLIYTVGTTTNFIYDLVGSNEWTLGKQMCVIISGLGPIPITVSAWILVRYV